MEDKVFEILRDVFELDTVDSTCSQETCDAWDSMGQLNLVAELEDAFGVSLEPDEIANMKTFDDIINLLKEKSA